MSTWQIGLKGVGLLCLAAVVFIWVASSVTLQALFKDQHYNKPFFATYFATSLFGIYLFGFLFMPTWKFDTGPIRNLYLRIVKGREEIRLEKDVQKDPETIPLAANENIPAPLTEPISSASVPASASASSSSPPQNSNSSQKHKDGEGEGDDGRVALRMWQVVRIAVIFCPIWFVANYTYNASLVFTSVSSSTILASSSSLFTLIFSVIVKLEKFSFLKLFAVLATMAGVTVVTYIDAADDGEDTLRGDALSLISAASYGLYTITLRKLIPHHNSLSTPMFYGFVGVLNVLLLWPLGLLLNFSHIERFEIPNWTRLLYLTANGLVGSVLSDILWLWAILLTSPLLVTIGISFAVPLAVLSDFIRGKKTSLKPLYIVGTLMIVAGFLGVNSHDQIMSWIASGCERLLGENNPLRQPPVLLPVEEEEQKSRETEEKKELNADA